MPNCNVCNDGYGLTDTKECEACTGKYFKDSTGYCKAVDNCAAGPTDNQPQSSPNCKVCKEGYGRIKDINGQYTGECEACKGTTYSDGNTECLMMDNCESVEDDTIAQKKPNCKVCDDGYGLVMED